MMEKIKLLFHYIKIIKIVTGIVFLCFYSVNAQETNCIYSTNKENITVWNGEKYVPFFLKGINLGVGLPGSFPGDLSPSYNQYLHWFALIKQAGFNCIRIYTLHFPRFYEALYDYNRDHENNPLLFIQGIWLEEEYPDYNNNLFNLTSVFSKEIQDNISAVHGNNKIEERQGKAYGEYKKDVSPWCLAYIIGREINPYEIQTTNTVNPDFSTFKGNHLSIGNASASEYWFTSMLDLALTFEQNNYKTQRPISVSSWPTLDPISHPEEPNGEEDSASLDFSKIQLTNAPAGFFISYHAYPYYPDFVSDQSTYQNYKDDYGPNSYKGYLTELKNHYKNFPLIIAEYGVPSSWVIAHYASSGMNHGGFDEYNQGGTDIRLLQTIKDTNCGGGIQFSLMDEWFKRTWITDPIDYIPESRILWQNLASAEQNFGLLTYEKPVKYSMVKSQNNDDAVTTIEADANYQFFALKLSLKNSFKNPDEIWVALDTYDENLGESILPNGIKIPKRSEYALKITNHSAELYVTRAYDIFGIWHHTSQQDQLYHSIATDGAPWDLVRFKNNNSNTAVQFVGNLQVNYDFQPASSKDAVTIADKSISIKIPWSYINVVAPDQKRVLNDDRSTPETESIISDGFAVNVFYENKWFSGDDRFVWENWNAQTVSDAIETPKISYYVMKDNLQNFNTPCISVNDNYSFEDGIFPKNISKDAGLLVNDYDLDGDVKETYIYDNPKNGTVFLNTDGSFYYLPEKNFTGVDTFTYVVFDGYSISESSTVKINVLKNGDVLGDRFLRAYPNPFTDNVFVDSSIHFDELELYNASGTLISKTKISEYPSHVNLSFLSKGMYLLIGKKDGKIFSFKMIKR